MSHCVFCHDIKLENILLETQHFFAIFDIDPIQQGHILLISKEHYLNIREIPDDNLLDLLKLEKKIISILEKDFNTLGVSVIQNNGSVMDLGTHFHVHLVPRYKDDLFWDNQDVPQHPIDIKALQEELRA